MRSGGSRPSDKVGERSCKKIFSASVWSNNKGRAGPPGPSPGPATAKQGDHLKKPILRKGTVCFRSLTVV